ncbi:DUF826 domain-containing protein [Escherichia coli O10]|nr:DUF826 domain-containing protein [Escherichia coli O10]
MAEINKLVTVDAVKAALRTEEVCGTLKETIRKTFESRIMGMWKRFWMRLSVLRKYSPERRRRRMMRQLVMHHRSQCPGMKHKQVIYCSQNLQRCCGTSRSGHQYQRWERDTDSCSCWTRSPRRSGRR